MCSPTLSFPDLAVGVVDYIDGFDLNDKKYRGIVVSGAIKMANSLSSPQIKKSQPNAEPTE